VGLSGRFLGQRPKHTGHKKGKPPFSLYIEAKHKHIKKRRPLKMPDYEAAQNEGFRTVGDRDFDNIF
jgi:hypothetical protein